MLKAAQTRGSHLPPVQGSQPHSPTPTKPGGSKQQPHLLQLGPQGPYSQEVQFPMGGPVPPPSHSGGFTPGGHSSVLNALGLSRHTFFFLQLVPFGSPGMPECPRESSSWQGLHWLHLLQDPGSWSHMGGFRPGHSSIFGSPVLGDLHICSFWHLIETPMGLQGDQGPHAWHVLLLGILVVLLLFLCDCSPSPSSKSGLWEFLSDGGLSLLLSAAISCLMFSRCWSSLLSRGPLASSW